MSQYLAFLLYKNVVGFVIGFPIAKIVTISDVTISGLCCICTKQSIKQLWTFPESFILIWGVLVPLLSAILHCGVHSVVMFSLLFFLKLRLPIGLHSSYCFSQPASGIFGNSFTKYHDWRDGRLDALFILCFYHRLRSQLAGQHVILYLITEFCQRGLFIKRYYIISGYHSSGPYCTKLDWIGPKILQMLTKMVNFPPF